MLSRKMVVFVTVFAMIAVLIMGGCGPTAAPQVITQVVKETVVVEGTPQVVEKEVTAIVTVEKEVTADAPGGQL